VLVGNGDPVGDREGSLPPFGAGDVVGPVSAAVGDVVGPVSAAVGYVVGPVSAAVGYVVGPVSAALGNTVVLLSVGSPVDDDDGGTLVSPVGADVELVVPTIVGS
jgi:hypothetical protein